MLVNESMCGNMLLLVPTFWELVILPGIEQVLNNWMLNEEMFIYFGMLVSVCL